MACFTHLSTLSCESQSYQGSAQGLLGAEAPVPASKVRWSLKAPGHSTGTGKGYRSCLLPRWSSGTVSSSVYVSSLSFSPSVCTLSLVIKTLPKNDAEPHAVLTFVDLVLWTLALFTPCHVCCCLCGQCVRRRLRLKNFTDSTSISAWPVAKFVRILGHLGIPIAI